MRKSTIENLDTIARHLADVFALDAVNRPGSLVREARPDFERLKNKTDVEFFKMTFRKDAKFIPNGMRLDGLDVSDREWSSLLKTPRQLNYLANEVCHRLKVRMWKDPRFAREYRPALSMRPRLVQGELPL